MFLRVGLPQTLVRSLGQTYAFLRPVEPHETFLFEGDKEFIELGVVDLKGGLYVFSCHVKARVYTVILGKKLKELRLVDRLLFRCGSVYRHRYAQFRMCLPRAPGDLFGEQFHGAPENNHPTGLHGASCDGVHLGNLHDLLQGVKECGPVASHELDRVEACLCRTFEVEYLDGIRVEGDVLSGVPHVSGVVRVEPCRSSLPYEIGYLELVRGHLHGRLAELHPSLGIGDGGPQRSLHPAHGLRRDDRPFKIEPARHDLPTVSFLSDAVPDRNLHVFEIEHAVLDIAESDKLVDLLNREALRALLKDEGGR